LVAIYAPYVPTWITFGVARFRVIVLLHIVSTPETYVHTDSDCLLKVTRGGVCWS
jgi:hypothetical protein